LWSRSKTYLVSLSSFVTAGPPAILRVDAPNMLKNNFRNRFTKFLRAIRTVAFAHKSGIDDHTGSLGRQGKRPAWTSIPLKRYSAPRIGRKLRFFDITWKQLDKTACLQVSIFRNRWRAVSVPTLLTVGIKNTLLF